VASRVGRRSGARLGGRGHGGVDADVAVLIDQAVEEAQAAPLPTAADLLTDVYVRY